MSMVLWKRLRVLANPVRLEMLTVLDSVPELYVQAAQRMACTEDIACKHLQMLGDAGFLASERRGRYLHYSVMAQDPLASAVLGAVRSGELDMGGILKCLTAFTHERRITIVKVLRGNEMGFEALSRRAHISPEALKRHLKKLRERGVLDVDSGQWRLVDPPSELGRSLTGFVAG